MWRIAEKAFFFIQITQIACWASGLAEGTGLEIYDGKVPGVTEMVLIKRVVVNAGFCQNSMNSLKMYQ